MADLSDQSELENAARLAAKPPEQNVADEVRLLIKAAREFAAAEVAYQSTRAKLMAKAAAWIAGGGAVAATMLFFVTMALVVGLLLALAVSLGPWGAMAAVVGGLLVVTAIAGLVAYLGLRRFMALLNDGKDPA